MLCISPLFVSLCNIPDYCYCVYVYSAYKDLLFVVLDRIFVMTNDIHAPIVSYFTFVRSCFVHGQLLQIKEMKSFLLHSIQLDQLRPFQLCEMSAKMTTELVCPTLQFNVVGFRTC
eukprot:377729_1